MIPEGAHTSTLQRFILKSLPVSQILRHWAGVRDLKWKEEQSLPPRILKTLEEMGWLNREGGPLLGDRRKCRAGLVYRRRNHRSITGGEYIRDLKEHLKACGRRPDDFVIFRPGQLNLNYSVEPDSQPLFFLFWAPERPPLERFLAGREKLPFTLLAEGGPEAQTLEPGASESANGLGRNGHGHPPARSEDSPGPEEPFSLRNHVSEEHAGFSSEGLADMPWKEQGYCRYALLGSTRGNRSFKFFIKYGPDHLRVFLFSSHEEISEDFLGSMFDALGHHDDPVQGYLEQIRVALPRDIHGLSLNLSADGHVEYCGFGLSPVLLRKGAPPRRLSDVKDYSHRFPDHRWRIARGRLRPEDRLLLCPSTIIDSELVEFGQTLQSGAKASSWLRYRGLGKALLLEARPFQDA